MQSRKNFRKSFAVNFLLIKIVDDEFEYRDDAYGPLKNLRNIYFDVQALRAHFTFIRSQFSLFPLKKCVGYHQVFQITFFQLRWKSFQSKSFLPKEVKRNDFDSHYNQGKCKWWHSSVYRTSRSETIFMCFIFKYKNLNTQIGRKMKRRQIRMKIQRKKQIYAINDSIIHRNSVMGLLANWTKCAYELLLV